METTVTPNLPPYELESLFLETRNLTTSKAAPKARYTLRDIDTSLPSLGRLYVECEDVSEVRFARKYLDSYSHWLALCACEWFAPFLSRWREELEMVLKSKAMDVITFHAQDETKHSFDASKFLATSGWKKGEGTKKTDKELKDILDAPRRGRPSKAEVQAKLDEEAMNTSRLKEDMARILPPRLN